MKAIVGTQLKLHLGPFLRGSVIPGMTIIYLMQLNTSLCRVAGHMQELEPACRTCQSKAPQMCSISDISGVAFIFSFLYIFSSLFANRSGRNLILLFLYATSFFAF